MVVSPYDEWTGHDECVVVSRGRRPEQVKEKKVKVKKVKKKKVKKKKKKKNKRDKRVSP